MADDLHVFTSPEGEARCQRAYQNVLEHWPVPYQEMDVPTEFGSTHAIVSGPVDGPAVVLLHALFATAASWYRTVGALSSQFRTIAIDVMGEANRSKPTRPIASLVDFRRWFEQTLDQLDVDTASLVGNSFGGFTAAWYAMSLPERVRNLVLIGPAATIRSMPAFYQHMFVPKSIYLLLPMLPGKERMMRRAVRWMHAGLPPDGIWSELFVEVMTHGAMTTRVFPRRYTAEEFRRIQAPTLLLLGDRERVYPIDDAIAQARRLVPGIQVEVIPEAHHIAAVANPQAVNQSLLRFFGFERGWSLAA